MGEVGGLGDSMSLVDGEETGEAVNGKNLPFVEFSGFMISFLSFLLDFRGLSTGFLLVWGWVDQETGKRVGAEIFRPVVLSFGIHRLAFFLTGDLWTGDRQTE